MRIGMFDDEHDMRTLLSDFLEDEGHQIVTLANSPEELKDIEQCDVLIMDVAAPNDRYAGINYIINKRHENKINQDATVIFISNFGRDNKEIKILLKKVGNYKWFDKPIEMPALKEALVEIAGEK